MKQSKIIKFLIGISISYIFIMIGGLNAFKSKILLSSYFGDIGPSLNPYFITRIDTIYEYFLILFTKVNATLYYINFFTIFISISIFFIVYIIIKQILGESYYSKLSAIIVGVSISMAPIRLRYAQEWASHANWIYILLFLYFLYILLTEFNKRHLLFLFITYLVMFVENPYHGIMSGIITFLLLISYTVHGLVKKNLTYLISSLKIGTSMLLASIPAITLLLIPNAKSNVTLLDLKRDETAIWAYSARPWHYFIPDINHPLFGNLSVKIHYLIWSQRPYYLTEPFFPKEHTLYLGFILLFFAFFALYTTFIKKTNDRRGTENQAYKSFVIFSLLICIFSFILSMPPYMGIDNIRVYFPSHFLYEYIPQFRAYSRYSLYLYVSIGYLAGVGIYYLLVQIGKKKVTYATICAITILLFMGIELSTSPNSKQISTKYPLPYEWLEKKSLDQNKVINYLEIPKRADYTDVLYSNPKHLNPINPYLRTPDKLQIYEQDLFSENFDPNNEIWCNFTDLDYILLHDKKNIYNDITSKFQNDRKVTDNLKVIISESWGYPAWGTHAPKPEKDKLQEERLQNLSKLMKEQPLFIVVEEYSMQEISNDLPNKNASANKLDEVIIFKINQEYCDNELKL